MTEESLSHREILLKKAREDFEAARNLAALDNFSEEIVLFHCQQAIEKMLKAYLDSKKIIYPKTHDVETLLSLCIEKDKAFGKIDFVTSLTPYAVEIRYDEFVSMSKEEVLDIVSRVKESLDFIIERV